MTGCAGRGGHVACCQRAACVCARLKGALPRAGEFKPESGEEEEEEEESSGGGSSEDESLVDSEDAGGEDDEDEEEDLEEAGLSWEELEEEAMQCAPAPSPNHTLPGCAACQGSCTQAHAVVVPVFGKSQGRLLARDPGARASGACPPPWVLRSCALSWRREVSMHAGAWTAETARVLNLRQSPSVMPMCEGARARRREDRQNANGDDDDDDDRGKRKKGGGGGGGGGGGKRARR